jgi:hypothetical protein
MNNQWKKESCFGQPRALKNKDGSASHLAIFIR